MASNFGLRIPSLVEKRLTESTESINTLKYQLLSMDITQNQMNNVVKLIKKLIAENKESIEYLLKNTVTHPEKIVEDVLDNSFKIFESIDSQYKRSKKPVFSIQYIEPEEKSTGYKFKHVYDENAGCYISKSIQTTFQFIPISKTLESLFSDSTFEKIYIDFNRNKNHICQDGVYHDFCCASVYKLSEFFKQNPLAIQIRLFTDDFEPCDALKSKAGVHKITSFYFQINNLPPNMLSKTENIYLVALSDASDSKNDLADVNNVIETIVADIKIIESKGIKTHSNLNFKGTLTCCQFDNLGGNLLFGFSGGFNANFYCRICTTKRVDCQQMIAENESSLRTKNTYNEIVSKIQSGQNISLTASQGIKSPCALNNLENFHVLSNVTVDLMHDIFEGIVGYLLEEIFNYCIYNNILTIERIQSLVHCFHYGELSKYNKPSKVVLEKKNLGQNASQARCLIFHLPFILAPFKDRLQPIWLAVESLLRILQILLSDEIAESDLLNLSDLKKTHLHCYQTYFQQTLKPNHHFLIHYANVIRKMGPVVRFWAMRMEAKHQYFKRIVYKSRNFINIKKTLALKHQSFFAASIISLSDTEHGKSIPFSECADFDKYYEQLIEIKFKNVSIQNSVVVKSLRYNDSVYKPGLFLVWKTQFLEIQFILFIENRILFLCNKIYDVQHYDSFLNSLKITSTDGELIVDLNELEIKKCFEKKILQESIHVIADNLSIFKMISK